jgi:tetratricopeptide (TPR) repeat protein
VRAAAPTRGMSLALSMGMALACLAAPARLAAQATAKDTVLLEDGSKETGKVVAENYDALQLEIKAGVKKGIEWKRVASVQYGALPVEYQDALAARASDPNSALAQFKEVLGQEGLGDVLRQSSMLEVAALQQRLGALDDAAGSWQTLIDSFPEGRYIGTAARGLVDAWLLKGDPAAAGKALDALNGNPAVGKFAALGTELKALRGRILMAQKKYADARTAFEQVEKDSTASPEVVAAARLGAAESLKEEGKTPEAEARFKQLVEEEGPNFLLAGAWNGLGDLRLKAGREARSPDLLTEALYAYLRGVVQYPPAAGETQDEYERSLHGSGVCFQGLGELEKNKDRKADYESDANRQFDRLRQQFPNSKYFAK